MRTFTVAVGINDVAIEQARWEVNNLIPGKVFDVSFRCVEFIEADSNNPSHGHLHFEVEVTGPDAQLVKELMNDE